jgi:hypothetical protein
MSAAHIKHLQDAASQKSKKHAGLPHQQRYIYFAHPDKDRKYVSAYSEHLLRTIAQRAHVASLLVTSTVRDAQEQAAAMFGNLHKPMRYAAAGKAVLAVARADQAAGKSRAQTINDMVQKINGVGLVHVTNHAYQAGLNTIDLSITHFGIFDDAPYAYSRVVHALIHAVNLGEVSRFGWPEAGKFGWGGGRRGNNKLFNDAGCLHVEIPQPYIGDLPATDAAMRAA